MVNLDTKIKLLKIYILAFNFRVRYADWSAQMPELPLPNCDYLISRFILSDVDLQIALPTQLVGIQLDINSSSVSVHYVSSFSEIHRLHRR